MSALADPIAAARELLESAGYVVLKTASYRKAQERQRVAEALRAAEEDRRRHYERWVAEDLGPRERHLIDRCTYLYGLAARHGATDDELRGPT